MKLLLMSGLGPYTANSHSLDVTLFAENGARELRDDYVQIAGQPIDLAALRYGGKSGYPLLRPYHGSMPHLPTEALRSIIESTDVEYEIFDLEALWSGAREPDGGHFDVVALSTSFIIEQSTLRRTLKWISKRYPGATLILGGQYSNLKSAEIMRNFCAVDYIIRGDAEVAFPMLIRVLEGKGNLGDIPNLTVRGNDGSIVTSPVEYIDVNVHPSPRFHGLHSVVPYESMRGCPFICKFCSYPAASPMWRYKSAEKICNDWMEYTENNGTNLVRAMDSTFTVPPKRFKRLLEVLPNLGIDWEAYSRANVIKEKEIVDNLEAARCKLLFIGFESMSDRTLRLMNKRVSSAQNERAHTLLEGSGVDLRTSFMVGYPGETPEDYELTHRFIVDRVRGRFGVHVFMLADETMPVWEDAETHQIDVTNSGTWSHIGMDSVTAHELRERTLFEARWKNEEGVLSLWQLSYERPLVPDLNLQKNYRIEKLLERLAFLRKDWGVGEASTHRFRSIFDELRSMGIEEAAV